MKGQIKPCKCYCDECTHWGVIEKRVAKLLKGKLRKDWDKLMLHYAHQILDGSVSQAKLDGTWPGWEWLPPEIEKRNQLTKAIGLRNKSLLKTQ